MNDHVQPDIADCLRGHFNIPPDFDFFAREEAKREKALERRMREHPDPRDPDHPGENYE